MDQDNILHMLSEDKLVITDDFLSEYNIDKIIFDKYNVQYHCKYMSNYNDLYEVAYVIEKNECKPYIFIKSIYDDELCKKPYSVLLSCIQYQNINRKKQNIKNKKVRYYLTFKQNYKEYWYDDGHSGPEFVEETFRSKYVGTDFSKAFKAWIEYNKM